MNLKKDWALSIMLLLLVGIAFLCAILTWLKILKLWTSVFIVLGVGAVPLIYGIIRYLNRKEPLPPPKRPELTQIMSRDESEQYIKQFFQNKFGKHITFNHENAYHYLKTVGSENYETKIYTACIKIQNKKEIYYVVHRGYDPDGLVFLYGERNVAKIREMEEGQAIKSQQFVIEETVHEDEMSGRVIKKRRKIPISEAKEEEAEEKKEGGVEIE